MADPGTCLNRGECNQLQLQGSRYEPVRHLFFDLRPGRNPRSAGALVVQSLVVFLGPAAFDPSRTCGHTSHWRRRSSRWPARRLIRQAPFTASSRAHSTGNQVSRRSGAASWWREQPSTELAERLFALATTDSFSLAEAACRGTPGQKSSCDSRPPDPPEIVLVPGARPCFYPPPGSRPCAIKPFSRTCRTVYPAFRFTRERENIAREQMAYVATQIATELGSTRRDQRRQPALRQPGNFDNSGT
jgi:hypothetical protein